MTGAGFAVPVFAACGADGWGAVQDLRACGAIDLVTTPRHASVLLVAGTIPDAHLEALDRVHDEVPHPRTSLAWPCGETSPPGPWAAVEADAGGIVEAIVTAHAHVAADPSRSEPDRMADVEPDEWRGVGPFGQGGEGMMGGVPYGRPMAMTGDDRDGLALDQLHLRLGPFLDAFPGGLVLDVTLQGEVVQECVAGREGAPRSKRGSTGELRHLAWALHVAGLEGLAARAARLAIGAAEDMGRSALAHGFGRLRRSIRRSGWLWNLRGVGPVEGLDAAQRWRHRLDGLDRAFDASGTQGDADPTGDRPAGGPCPLEALGDVLEGLTVTDAVTTIASLDLASESEVTRTAGDQ